MAFRKINIDKAVNTTNTELDDTLIILGGSTYSGDIGFLGKRAASTYAGLIRDNTTETFVLIDSYTTTISGNDIDATNALLQKGSLLVDSITAETSIVLPKGTTAQRPVAPEEGQMWFNTETKMFEGYDGTQWIVLIPSTLVQE